MMKMNENIIEGLEASIFLCKYFATPEAILKDRERFIKKIKLSNNKISFTILLDLVQTKIQEGSSSLLLVKYRDNTYEHYTSFKILTEILLNPQKNIQKFKSGLYLSKKLVDDFQKLLEEEGSINQLLAFARKDEEMQGAGYYSVVFSAKSEEELRKQPSKVLDDVIDECRFEVV